MKNAKPITPELIAKFSQNFDSNPALGTLSVALSKSALNDAAVDVFAAAKNEFKFSIDLKTHGITNQQASGRCWLFAGMNVLREIVSEKCNTEKVELSQNYIAFWDKFEKINYSLESIIDTADLPADDRTVNWILSGLNDGGQWDMIVSLIKKYGVVPIAAMPETYHSSHTGNMNQMLNSKLREYAIELRAIVNAGQCPQARKEEMLGEMYNALCICFGKPVETFDFEYIDKDKNYHIDRGLTPHTFFDKYIGINVEDYISVINGPTQDKPFNKSYTVQYLGNVVGGSIKYLNVDMDTLKDLIVKQMKDGEPVWFGSDCGKYSDRAGGVWDIDSFHYGELLGGLTFGLTKEQRLDYRDSAMNHAMVITGVNLDEDGKPNRWKIENSWGDQAGNKGYYVMSAAWFDQFVYQAVINRKYLTPELSAAYDAEPIELKPWDPMGSLA